MSFIIEKILIPEKNQVVSETIQNELYFYEPTHLVEQTRITQNNSIKYKIIEISNNI
jgi:hypothetical protein